MSWSLSFVLPDAPAASADGGRDKSLASIADACNRGGAAVQALSGLEAGVKPKLANGAATLIEQSNQMVVENDELGRVVLAETPHGPRSAQALVDDFLESEDGKGFRPLPTETASSYFSDMLGVMKRGGEALEHNRNIVDTGHFCRFC